MFFSLRNRLFVISLVLLAVFMAGMGIYLHQTLRDWSESRIEADLQARAELVANAIRAADGPELSADFVQQLGGPDDQRITLVDAGGNLVADTHLTADEIEGAEPHADRPEIQAAYEGDLGLARRHSDTVGVDMLYAAVPADDEAVVRVSVPLEEVDEALAHLRFLLILGGLIGIGVAIFMSSIAARMMSDVLQQVLQRARPERDGADRPDGPAESTTVYDLTQRLEKSMDLLVHERNRFRAVLDGMNEGIIATDADATVTLTNRPAVELLDADGELEGMPLADVVPRDVADALTGGDSDSEEFELSGQPARRIHVSATARPGADGHILVLHDVTTLRRLETMRRDFVANVSHELRTPVTVIQANAETLLDGALNDPEHARSFTEGIQRNAERLSHLVSDLLDLSRIESGQSDLQLEPLSLQDAIRRGVDDIEDRLDDGPGFRIEVPDDVTVVADRDGVHRVLLNLLENATKYGESDQPVELRAHSDDGSVTVEVRDYGPGIDEEHRDRIFERFYRVDSGRAAERGGTGLGLAIVKHLVGSMNGQVGYRPADGDGSVFWFTLPRPD